MGVWGRAFQAKRTANTKSENQRQPGMGKKLEGSYWGWRDMKGTESDGSELKEAGGI